jgi:hypothetical protein
MVASPRSRSSPITVDIRGESTVVERVLGGEGVMPLGLGKKLLGASEA